MPFMIHVVLLFLTFLTTTFGGSFAEGGNPFRNPIELFLGLSYSVPLLIILLAHELGHYFACRRHRLQATLPYFIPAPPPIFLFGTFGAFIKIKSPIQDRRALLDVGVAGPLTGMVFALPVAILGIAKSSFVPMESAEGGLMLGDSLLFLFLVRLLKGPTPEGVQLLLHPMAFAGWIGFLVTAFNLLPASQLDGGHIFYSLWPKRHRLMTRIVVAGLLLLGLTTWQGWFIWAILITVMGTRHPPVMQDLRENWNGYPWETPYGMLPGLDSRRRRLGFAALVIFILTFTPVPLQYFMPESEPPPATMEPTPPPPREVRDDWVRTVQPSGDDDDWSQADLNVTFTNYSTDPSA
jgi:membrane-associated protease RseP (regulator of RpoE activity)